jgi:hypothetical protein
MELHLLMARGSGVDLDPGRLQLDSHGKRNTQVAMDLERW